MGEQPDDLKELEGLFQRQAPKEARPVSKEKPKVKTEAKTETNKKSKPKAKPEQSKDDKSFFANEDKNAVSMAKKVAEMKSVLKSAESEEAIADMLTGINWSSGGSSLRNFRISVPHGDLVDRFQDLLRYKYGFMRREVPQRKILEMLLEMLAKDLDEHGPESKYIKMMLEEKYLKD